MFEKLDKPSVETGFIAGVTLSLILFVLVFCAFYFSDARSQKKEQESMGILSMLASHMEPNRVYKLIHRSDGVWDMTTTDDFLFSPSSTTVWHK